MALSQQDIELNQRLTSFINTFANGNASLQNTIREQTRRMIGAQDEVIDEYENHLNQARSWTTKESKVIKDHLLKLKRIEADRDGILKASMMREQKSRKELTDLNRKYGEIEAKSRAAGISQSAKNKFTAELVKLSARIAETTNEHATAKALSLAAMQTTRNAAAERQRLEHQQLTRSAEWGDKLRDTMRTGALKAVTGMFGGATIGSAMKDVGTQAKNAIVEGMRTGGMGISLSSDDKFNTGTMAKFGYNMEAAVKLQAENRRAIVSSTNGVNEFVDGLERAHTELADQIADPLERSQVAVNSFNIAIQSGIRMNKNQATMFAANMKKTAVITGETGMDFTKNISSIMESEEVQANLRQKTSEQERKAILNNIQAQYTQYRAMGMTSEQAIKTAKYLATLGTKKGKTVIQDAARISAMAGAMGMGAEGQRMTQLMYKRNTRTSAEETELRELMAGLRNVVDEQAGGAVSGLSLAVEGLMEGLKTDENLPSLLNDAMAKAVAPQQEGIDSMKKIPDELKTVTSSILDFKAMVENSITGQLAKGAGGSLMESLTGSAGGSFAGTVLGRMIPGLGGGAAAAGAGGAAAAGAGGAAAAGAGGAAAAGGVTAGGVAAAAGVAALATAAIAAGGTALMAGVNAAQGKDSSNWISKAFEDATGGFNIFEAILGDPAEKYEEEEKAFNKAMEERKAKMATENKTKPVPITPETVKKPELSQAEQQAMDDKKKADVDNSKRMDTMVNTLKTLSETSAKQLDVSEKQLIALTMSEQERTQADVRASLRRDNRFGSSYGYV